MMDSRTATSDLDRLCLHAYAVASPDDWTGREAQLRSLGPERWSWLANHAEGQGFAGLLARNLAWAEESCGLRIPVLPRLGALRRDQLLQHLNRKAAARRVADALSAKGIPLVAFKGVALTEEVYGDLSLRAFHDFDVMVPFESLEEAYGIVLALGYRLELFAHVRELVASGAHAAGMGHPDGSSVDLHWAISADLLEPEQVASVWRSCRPAPPGSSLPGLRMSPEMTMIHLAKHFHSHQYCSLKPLIDFYVAARRYGSAIDARALADTARVLGILPIVDIAARLCERSFIPGSLPASLTEAPPGIQARLARNLLTDSFLVHSPRRSRIGNWLRYLAAAGGLRAAAASVANILVPGKLVLSQFFNRAYQPGMYPRYYWRQVVKVFTLSNR